jgi:hypothetical protein
VCSGFALCRACCRFGELCIQEIGFGATALTVAACSSVSRSLAAVCVLLLRLQKSLYIAVGGCALGSCWARLLQCRLCVVSACRCCMKQKCKLVGCKRAPLSGPCPGCMPWAQQQAVCLYMQDVCAVVVAFMVRNRRPSVTLAMSHAKCWLIQESVCTPLGEGHCGFGQRVVCSQLRTGRTGAGLLCCIGCPQKACGPRQAATASSGAAVGVTGVQHVELSQSRAPKALL